MVDREDSREPLLIGGGGAATMDEENTSADIIDTPGTVVSVEPS